MIFRIPHKTWFYLVSILLLLILILHAHKAPVNVDEFPHNGQAKEVVRWFLTMGEDEECLEDNPDNLRYYGQSVDNIAAFLNHIFKIEQEYLLRHYFGAIIGWLLLLFTGWLTFQFTQNYFIAIVSMVLLFISPRPFGQVFGNLKDIPFALGYIWASYGLVKFVKELPKPTMSSTLLLASGIAFANSVRIGGIIFYPIIGMFVLVWFLFNYREHINTLLLKESLLHYLKIILILVGVGYFFALILWPYALKNPIVNPIKSLSLMQHYSISIRQIFEGDFIWSTHLPWYYVLKWLLISWPEVILLSLTLYAGCSIALLRNKPWTFNRLSSHLILIFCAVFPLAYVIAINSNLYSGWRQLYFVYPLIIVIAAIGINKTWQLLKNKVYKISFAVFLILLSILPIKHTVQTFPADYVYFNSFVGGNKTAWANYEYDYYFHGMKEAAEWLIQNEELPSGSVVASNLDLKPYFPKNMEVKSRYTHYYYHYRKKWDFAILCNNYVQPYQLKNDTWIPEEPIKTFYHKGNPYIIILKWDGDDVTQAFEKYRLGQFSEAQTFFQKAVSRKPNNADLILYLGECYLRNSDYPELESLLQKAYRINPEYEAFLHLEARKEFKEKNFKQSLYLTQKLLSINPKYKKAFPLLKACFKEMGQLEKAEIIELQINKNK